MSTLNNLPTENTNNTANKMFDLKMCFLDLMRITTNGRQKKSLKELSNRNHPQYMHQKFKDMNTIYFNENMSMTSRCNTIRFSRCPTGNFNPNAVNPLRSNRQQSVYEWVDCKDSKVSQNSSRKPSLTSSPLGQPLNRFSLSESRLPSLSYHHSEFFDTSSDDRMQSTVDAMSSFTDSPLSDSSMRETETDDCICSFSDCGQTTMIDANSAAGLDSFCTLCTSSFSFNRCNQCEDSSCGSKCNSSQRNESKKLIDRIEDASGGGECTSSSGAMSSDCESIQFR